MVGEAASGLSGVVEFVEEVGLERGAHDDQTHLATLLDGLDEGAENVGLQRPFVRLIDDDHAVSGWEGGKTATG